MAREFSPPLSSATPSSNTLPRVNLLTMFRLGLFQMGLGMMSVLTLGLLNRVMVSELSIPLAIAAGVISMHQFIAPARVWFGQLSDARPIAGTHRTNYVRIGAVLFSLFAFLAVQGMWQLGQAVGVQEQWQWTAQTLGWTGVLGLIFAAYGLALSSSSTPFAALLVDISEEDDRSKLVGIVWSMLMVGIVIGAIVTSIFLENVEVSADLVTVQASINRLFLIVPAVVVGLALVGTWGIEQRYSRYKQRSALVEREDQITLGRALRVLTASRQTGLFFVFLLAMTTGLFMQEAVLENYGAEIFQMPIADTTQLNAYFGIGTLVGLSVTGFAVVPRLGKQHTTYLGCLFVALCFGLMILAGFTQEVQVLKGSVLLFGLASGMTTTGAISLMLDLTAAETAGTFIGAWGLAQALARASATWLGGIVQTLGEQIFANPLLAYSLVFLAEAGAMLLAISLLRQVDVQDFQTTTRQAIATVMEGEID